MKIVFKKQIHSCFASGSSNDIWLHYIMELPFLPPIGMEICEGDWSDCVESLCYVDGVVFVFTGADKELYDFDLHKMKGTRRTVEEVAAEYLEEGYWVQSTGILGDEG